MMSRQTKLLEETAVKVAPPDNRSFVETSKFPWEMVNRASAREKGPGRPPYWDMVFWWTRKPLAGARALVAGSLLPADFDKATFISMTKLAMSSPHRMAPLIPQKIYERYFKRKKVLDPFAGFGSIPLETSRLGVDAVAVELLPTAYVFLKAILEYPRKAANDNRWFCLKDDVKKWGEWVTQQLREDPDIKELYDPDVAVYIGTWEVKCPACGKYTPLIGNWWLARVKGKAGYKRLAWMDWSNGALAIKDLNRELKSNIIRATVDKNIVLCTGGEYTLKEVNNNTRGEKATCLFCNVEIDHRVVGGRVAKFERKEGVWYVKHAIREWNENVEKFLKDEITLQQLLESSARPTLLVKVKKINRNLEFNSITPKDKEKIWKALKKLKQIWGDPDIPYELFAPYQMGTAGAFRITLWGFDRFYKLFNPRQLLTLVKLVKLIRIAGKRIEEKKMKEEWSKEEAFEYAEAVTTYLAITLANHVRHNCLTTSVEPTRKFVSHALAFRGIAMTWNWIDEYPLTDIIGSFTRSLKTVINGFSYLVSAVSRSPNGVKVLLDDASVLSKLGDEKFDAVVTDPPYADDVPYVELSDFYYVWLKRTLCDADSGVLKPRFLSEAFFDEFGVEISTQWQNFARYEVSKNPGRFNHFGMEESYDALLTNAFANILQRLRDGGVIATYYVAKKQDAWISLIDALWRRLGMTITAAYPLETEMKESVVARGKASVTGGFAIVWRRRESVGGFDSVDLADPEQRRKLVEIVSSEFSKYKEFKENFFIFSFIAGLSALLRYKEIKRGNIALSVKDIISVASSIGFEGALKSIGIEVKEPAALSYLLLRLASPKNTIDSGTLTYVTYATGMDDSEMIKAGLITPIEKGGAKVAKRKTYAVNMPSQAVAGDVAAALSSVRGKSKVMEAFRDFQLGVLTPSFKIESLKKKHGEVLNDVLGLCRAFVELGVSNILSADDPDVKTSQAILGIRLKLI